MDFCPSSQSPRKLSVRTVNVPGRSMLAMAWTLKTGVVLRSLHFRVWPPGACLDRSCRRGLTRRVFPASRRGKAMSMSKRSMIVTSNASSTATASSRDEKVGVQVAVVLGEPPVPAPCIAGGLGKVFRRGCFFFKLEEDITWYIEDARPRQHGDDD